MHHFECKRSRAQDGIAERDAELIRLLIDRVVCDMQPGGGVQAEKSRALGDGREPIVGVPGVIDAGVELVNGPRQPV